MMHSNPTSFDFCWPHTCTAAHIRDVQMMMMTTSPSSRPAVPLATRGLLPYERYVSIFQDLCLPVMYSVYLSCFLFVTICAYSLLKPQIFLQEIINHALRFTILIYEFVFNVYKNVEIRQNNFVPILL